MFHTFVPRSVFFTLLISLALSACQNGKPPCTPQDSSSVADLTDSLARDLKWPEDLTITAFSGPEVTPSPAVLAVAPTGEVFVGVDMIGSLGKEMGRGAIVRLVDCDRVGTG